MVRPLVVIYGCSSKLFHSSILLGTYLLGYCFWNCVRWHYQGEKVNKELRIDYNNKDFDDFMILNSKLKF